MRTAFVLVAMLASASARADQDRSSLIASGGDVTYSETTAGTLTKLADPAGGGAEVPLLAALATNRKTGTVYGIDEGGWPTLAMDIVTFDASGGVSATAQITYKGAPVLVAEGLAIASNGTPWISFGAGADYEFYESGHIGQIDPTTGIIDASTVLTLTGYHNIDADALEFINGTLFMNDNIAGVGSNLYTINTATGAATLVGQVKDASTWYQVTDLAWDGSTLWAETYSDTGGQLVKINWHSGGATAVGSPHTEVVDGIAPSSSSACCGEKHS